ncbi:unnamed protein product [Meganyctiphanes norvegica]|uniref:Uncharacterized protein n=1 Tax=Meganyctiphanes norvegica TaxID=48144 RepID=A0AAV2PIS9_MEGNR
MDEFGWVFTLLTPLDMLIINSIAKKNTHSPTKIHPLIRNRQIFPTETTFLLITALQQHLLIGNCYQFFYIYVILCKQYNINITFFFTKVCKTRIVGNQII